MDDDRAAEDQAVSADELAVSARGQEPGQALSQRGRDRGPLPAVTSVGRARQQTCAYAELIRDRGRCPDHPLIEAAEQERPLLLVDRDRRHEQRGRDQRQDTSEHTRAQRHVHSLGSRRQ